VGRTSEDGFGREEEGDSRIFLLRHDWVSGGNVGERIGRRVNDESGRRKIVVGTEAESSLSSKIALFASKVDETGE